MTTPTNDLLAARATAGAAYAAAANAYWTAFIELFAIEAALQNSEFQTAVTPSTGLRHGPDPVAMRHAEFTPGINDAPDGAAFNWVERARARSIEIITNGSVE